MSTWLTLGLLAAVAAPTPEVDPRVKAAVQKTGPAIDACVAAYLGDEPEARGTARVVTTHDRSGQVLIASVDATRLPRPRRFASCLDGVARSWALPPLEQERGKLEIVVAVYPGAKFTLDPPKKPPEAAEPDAPPPPLGEFTFTPGGFWNPTWGGSGSGALPGDAPEAGPGTGADPENGQGTGFEPETGPGTGAAPEEDPATGAAPEDGPGTGVAPEDEVARS